MLVVATVMVIYTIVALFGQRTNWKIKKAFIVNHVFFWIILLF